MAYYLDINPSNRAGNQYVTIPTFDITGDFTVEIDCEIYNTTGTSADGFVFSGGTTVGGSELYRDGVAQNYRAVFWRNGVSFPVSTTNIWPYASGSTANPRKVILQRIGASMTSSFGGVSGSSVPFISADNLRITTIGARQGGTFTLGMRLYRMRLYQGATLVRDYDPSNTSSGVTLIDAVGGQNGTFQNPPGGNAQWVFYSSGGAITAASSFTMPQMAAAISSTVTAPVYSAAVSVTMPQMAVAASASNSAPVYSSSVSFVMPQMQVAANASASVSGNSAVIAFSMPQMVAAIDAASSVPAYSASVSVTMPQMSVSASAVSALPAGNTATVDFAMPQFTVSASGSTSAPSISAAISFTMPQMIVQVSTFEAEYFAADNIELAEVSRHIELAPASSRIELASQSAALELIAASRHIEYTNQSSHLEWRA